MALVKTTARVADESVPLVCSNVGPAGAYFATRATIAAGTRLLIQLRAQGHNAPLIDVQAEVLWAGQEVGNQSAGVGVRWLRADSSVGAEPLRALLRTLMRLQDLGTLQRVTSAKASFDFVAHHAARAEEIATARRAQAATMRPMVVSRPEATRADPMRSDATRTTSRILTSGPDGADPEISSVSALRTDSVMPGQTAWERRNAQRRGSGLRTFATPMHEGSDLTRAAPELVHHQPPQHLAPHPTGTPHSSHAPHTSHLSHLTQPSSAQSRHAPTQLQYGVSLQAPLAQRPPSQPTPAQRHTSSQTRLPEPPPLPSTEVRPPPAIPSGGAARQALAVETTLSHTGGLHSQPGSAPLLHHAHRPPGAAAPVALPKSPPQMSSSQITATPGGLSLPRLSESQVQPTGQRSWPTGVPRSLAERYAELTLLGQGGHGVVFRAMDLLLERFVVLKFLAGTGMAADQARRYFLREFKVTADLIHPNIVRLYDIGSADGTLYYTMEYVPGHPLGQYLGKNQRIEDHPFVYSVFAQLASALDHAHAKSVLHRDVKPNNVLVAEDGSVRLFDFGLARLLADGGKDQSMVVGTPFYMAPEMQRTSPIDHRADQYALGVVLYRMLTGRAPFADGNVFLAHAIAPVPDPRVFHAELPGAVSPVLLKMLAKDPDARFDSCAEAAAALHPALLGR